MDQELVTGSRQFSFCHLRSLGTAIAYMHDSDSTDSFAIYLGEILVMTALLHGNLLHLGHWIVFHHFFITAHGSVFYRERRSTRHRATNEIGIDFVFLLL